MSLLQDFATILLVAGLAGWLFRKLGLSAVVGYLLAGVFIGPSTPPFSLVSDVARIQDLSELGLVFLMFFVGMGLSLQRIKRIGGSVVVATALTALAVFSLAQIFAWAMGWDENAGLIFSGMLMVSSSAIISRMLSERRLSHERFAQNALGITVLEDVVAVIMLAVIGSRLHAQGDAATSLGQTLSLLLGFTALLIVLGVMMIPRILRPIGNAANADLKSLVVSGLVFGAGVISLRAGFSVALGAFLFGVVIAETPFKAQIERHLGGAQDMFSAIFFVSIGMMIDVQSFAEHIGLIVGISFFAIVVRIGAASLGLVGGGLTLGAAASSAIILTPIGEFSYIIAQMGVASAAVPGSFYAVAVGVSLLTATFAPLGARWAEPFGNWLERCQPKTVRRCLLWYQECLQALSHRAAMSQVWQHARRGVLAVALEMIMLGGVLGFSDSVRREIDRFLIRADYGFPGWNYFYWGAITVLGTILTAAILRNFNALSLLFAEAMTMPSKVLSPFRGVIYLGLQVFGVIALASVVFFTFPMTTSVPWLAFLVLAAMGFFAAVLWRHLIHLQSRLERTLAESVSGDESARSQMIRTSGENGRKNWAMDVAAIHLPDQAACAGKTIRELALRARLGCSILEIDRQGFVIGNITGDVALYPGDRILLFGNEDQIQTARQELSTERTFTPDESDFDEAILETVTVPAHSPLVGKTLIDLNVFKQTGVQILGLEKNGRRTLNPAGDLTLEASDRLLIMATNSEIRVFSDWMETAG